MSAYLLVQVKVTDEEQYAQYRALTPAIIEKYGGRFLARGGEFRVLEGPDDLNRVVLIEFPSLEMAQSFYDSPEYREARAIRETAARGQLIAVESS